MKSNLSTTSSLICGVLAALGASACCVGPLLLVTLGIGGAWATSFRALEPLFPVFVLAAIVFFGMAFWKLYREPAACAADATCTAPRVKRWQRVLFWVLAIKATLLITFPWYSPFIFA